MKNQQLSEDFSTIIADSDPIEIMKKRNRGQYIQSGRQQFDCNS